MSKKKQKHGKQKPPAHPPDTIRTRKKPSGSLSQNRVVSTLFLVIKPLIFIGAVWTLVALNKGYARLYKYNIVKIFDDMEKYKGLSYDEKLKKMLPQDFTFLSFVKEGTPPDAVILAPPKEIWYPKDRKLGFGSWMYTRCYQAYFLYPRKILYDAPPCKSTLASSGDLPFSEKFIAHP